MFFYAPGLFIVMLEPVLVLVSFSLSPLRPMRAGTHVFGTLINLILKCNQVSLSQLNSNHLEFGKIQGKSVTDRQTDQPTDQPEGQSHLYQFDK